MDDVRDPALESAIADDLERRENYLVYADWLATRGHPRGELILVQDALSSEPQNPELQAAQARLLDDHRDALSCEGASMLAQVEVDWHMGFWRAVRVELEDTATSTAGIEALLAHPSAALLQSLTIHGGSSSGSVFSNVATLLSNPALPAGRTLRALALGSRKVQLRWSPAMLADSLPRLEHLELRSSSFDRDLDWQLPPLRSFTLLTRAFGRKQLERLKRSLPTELRGLTLDVHDYDWSLQDIEAILDGSSHPRLTRLGLLCSLDLVELFAALRRSPLLAQLHELGLRLTSGWSYDEELHEILRDPALASKQLFTSADASAAEHYHFATFLRSALRRPADALVAYEAALRDEPENMAVWEGHGLAHFDLGQQPEAERSYREALRIEPADGYAWHNLALCLKRQKRYAEALDAFRRGNVPNQRPGIKLHCIGHMLQEIGERDEARRTLEAAIDCYTEALRDEPDDGELLFWRGAAHARLQQRAEALADLRRAIASDERWRSTARTEEDFADMRDDSHFLALLAGLTAG